MRSIQLATIATIATLIAVVAAGACAQDYPNKPIRVVIAGGAGSSPDIVARLLGSAWNLPD